MAEPVPGAGEHPGGDAGLWVAVDGDPVDGEALRRRVEDPECGAVVLFLGAVRRRNRGREVEALAYEAYDAMAVEELGRVGREALERFDVERVAVRHRTGELRPGTTAVGVAVAAGHRGPAFEAARWIMEELKRRVPLWKRERYADGEERWLDGEVPGPGGGRS